MANIALRGDTFRLIGCLKLCGFDQRDVDFIVVCAAFVLFVALVVVIGLIFFLSYIRLYCIVEILSINMKHDHSIAWFRRFELYYGPFILLSCHVNGSHFHVANDNKRLAPLPSCWNLILNLS